MEPGPHDRLVHPPARLLAVLLAGIAGAAASSAPAGPPPAARSANLLWPLQVPGTLLSTFGEYRYDHLHAGIDISTGGATGYRVLAADAGEVVRLKVEWRGYGRALYLRHADGRFTVYGHLERYEDAVLGLEKRVAVRQSEARTRYPGDIYLDPPVRVRRGQLIAYSGESGVGLPHLHFEVRDGADRPMDPFLAGLRPPADARPPVLESLTITAATPDVFVEGDRREMTYTLRPHGDLFDTERPVRVSGPFLAALSAYDPAGAEGRAGVHRIEAEIDGSRRYRLLFQEFRFDQYPEAGLIFDHRASRLGPARFSYRLTRLPGNALATGDEPPAETSGPPGALVLGAGAHVLTIAVADEAGNLSRARVCLLVGAPPLPELLPGGGSDGAVVRFRDASAVAPPAGPLRRPSRSAPCDGSATGVEGEFWSAAEGRFLPLVCRLDRGACTAGAAAPPDAPLVRLRAVAGGVPGRWRLAGAGAPGGEAPIREATAEFWPGFVDLLLRLDGPAEPPLTLAGAGGVGPAGAFVYRTGTTVAAAVPYAALATLPEIRAAAAPGGQAPVARWNLRIGLALPGKPLTETAGDASVAVPEGGRFFAGPLVLRRVDAAPSPGLVAGTEALDLLPEGEALDAPGSIRFAAVGTPEELRPLGIYRWDAQHQRWDYEGGDPDPSGGALVLRFHRYGRFALLRDASPPVVTEVRPGDGERGVGRRPSLTARVEEIGEGLDFDGVAFVLDGGAPLESEFDPDRGTARVLDPPSLAPGRHRLTVTATDHAGNLSAPVEATFEVR